MNIQGISLTYFLAVVFFMTLLGCDDDPIDSPGVSTISYELDGEAIDHRAVGSINTYDRLLEDSLVVELNKTASETPFITIFFNVNSTVDLLGTYPFDREENHGIFLELITDNGFTIFGSSSCLDVSGEIIVTEVDLEQRQISGTFSGTVCNSADIRTISNGVFQNVRYVIQVQEE